MSLLCIFLAASISVNPFIGASTSIDAAGIYHGLGKTYPGTTAIVTCSTPKPAGSSPKIKMAIGCHIQRKAV